MAKNTKIHYMKTLKLLKKLVTYDIIVYIQCAKKFTNGAKCVEV